MSDLLAVDQKTREADEWRGTTEVSFDETEVVEREDEDGNTVEVEQPVTYELTYRQLYEDQFGNAVDRIGADNFQQKIESLKNTTEGLDQEQLQIYRELSGKDPESLTEEDREKMQSIANAVNGDDDGEGKGVSEILELMDPQMIDGLHYAAKKGVVPDEDDVKEVLDMTVPEQKERFGDVIQTEDKARKELQKMVERMVDRSTGLTAYSLGLSVLMESMGGGAAKN